jgi:serine/threonine protein kinase
MPLPHAERVGPYDILETLGQGAMGDVYLARDSRLSRNVAIKTISQAGESDPVRRNRFLQEARSASALNHPNIVTIHDFGTDNGISYIVTELVDGESLRKLLERGPMTLRQVLDIAVQIADALAAAHEAGIVHRDLKPENIMITRTGRVKLLDFGLAKAVIMGGDAEHTIDELRTEPGLLVGTVAYMSPEQARGAQVSLQSDQFSFGVILHEMVTSNHPLRRETPMETLIAIANFDRAPFTPGPVALRLLVERAMSKDPAKRFAKTSEIQERLVKIRGELPETQRPKPAKIRWWQKISPRVVALTLAGLLLFSLGAVAAARLLHPAAADPISYRFVPFSADHRIELFPAWAPHNRVIAYSAEQDGILQIFTRSTKSGLATQVTRSDSDCLFPFWNGDGSRLYYIADRGGLPALWSISATSGSPDLVFDDVVSAALSPDGKRLAMLRSGGQGETWSLWMSTNGAQPQRYMGAPFDREAFFAGSRLGFSPDGSKLGFWASRVNGHSGFWILPLDGGAPRKIFRELDANPQARSFSWMPDGLHVLYSERTSLALDDHLWIGDTERDQVRMVTNGTGREQFPSVSPNGGEAAFASMDTEYHLHDIAIGNSPRSAASPGTISKVSPAWSPLRPEYAYVSMQDGAPEIRLRSASSGWERVLVSAKDFSGHTAFLLDLAFAPDGQSIAFRRGGDGTEAIWVATLSGEPPVRLAGGDGFERGPAWSADGNWIVYFTVRNGKLTLMKARVGSSAKPVLVREDGGIYPAWSPREDWIASLRRDSGINLVSADGKELRRSGTGEWMAATWSRDGSQVIGLRRTSGRQLELVSLNPKTGTEAVIQPLGPVPAAFAYGRAIGMLPVRGLSLAPDGRTATYSSLETTSAIWILKGLGETGGKKL